MEEELNEKIYKYFRELIKEREKNNNSYTVNLNNNKTENKINKYGKNTHYNKIIFFNKK